MHLQYVCIHIASMQLSHAGLYTQLTHPFCMNSDWPCIGLLEVFIIMLTSCNCVFRDPNTTSLC